MKKGNNKNEKQLTVAWHDMMSKNFFELAKTCASRGYSENYEYWMSKYRYHMKLS